MRSVRIERDRCVSCGGCWTICPEVFAEDPIEGTALVRATSCEPMADTADPDACAARAADACPIGIIHVQPE